MNRSAYAALEEALLPPRLWSLLLAVMQRRAANGSLGASRKSTR